MASNEEVLGEHRLVVDLPFLHNVLQQLFVGLERTQMLEELRLLHLKECLLSLALRVFAVQIGLSERLRHNEARKLLAVVYLLLHGVRVVQPRSHAVLVGESVQTVC